VSDLIIPDVSEFQGTVDWRRLVAGGYPAAIVRAHNGARADAQWPRNRDQAHAAGIQALGLYQYVVADRDAAVQAGEFCDLVGSLRPGEWPVCDLEVGAGDQAARARAWYTTVAARLQHAEAVELYSGLAFYEAHGLAAAGYPRVWLAAYGPIEPGLPHELWQYTDARTVPGIGLCDASVFHGTLADLLIHITPEDEMPLTQADAELTARTLLAATVTSSFRKDAKGNAAQIPVSAYLNYLDGHYDATTRQVAGLAAQVAAQGAVLAALSKGGGITTAEITAAAEAGAAAAYAALGHTLVASEPPTT